MKSRICLLLILLMATAAGILPGSTASAGGGAPTITSLSSTADFAGRIVIITGTEFGADPVTHDTTYARFGSFAPAEGDYISWTDTLIYLRVPVAAYGSADVLVHTDMGGDSNSSPFTVTPHLLSLDPSIGPVGAAVTVAGSGFGPTSQGPSAVYFGSTEATDIDSWSNDQIIASVPPGEIGPAAVKVAAFGNDSNTLQFLVDDQHPEITSLSDTSDYPGRPVTITGQGFGADPGEHSATFVRFGMFEPADSDYLAWEDDSVIVKVPADAYGPADVKVHTETGGDSNTSPFSVEPHLSMLDPTQGSVGTQVTISGSGFGPSQGDSMVTFGATEAADVNSWSNNLVEVNVPVTAVAELPVRISANGALSNSLQFAVQSSPPAVSSISALSAYPGTAVIINGTGFGPVPNGHRQYYVVFGGFTPAEDDYVSWSDTAIKVKVPENAYGAAIQVKVHLGDIGDSNSVPFYVAPYITGVSPTYGNAGVSTVTVTGKGFGPDQQGNSSVWFGSSKSTSYSYWSNTQVECKVGAGAQGQAKVKMMASCCWSNAKAFDVRPVINGMSPSEGPAGTVLTIDGSAFCNVKGKGNVCFRKPEGAYVYATDYVSWKQTQVKVKVPAGLPAGPIQVKVYTLGGLSNQKVFKKT